MKKPLLLLFTLSSLSLTAQLTQPNLIMPSNDGGDCPQPRVTFYGMTSLNSSTEDLVDNITASGRLAVNLSLRKDGRFNINLAANLINTGTRTDKKDSVDFNSLMFPETGNFGFMFNPSLRLITFKGSSSTSNHTLSLDGTYSYRRISIDSPAVSFKINSVNLGLKYKWYYQNPDECDEAFTFTLMPYWNLFNIPDEDVKRFNTIMKDTTFGQVNRNAEIYSIGIKTTVQFKNFIFFADLRRNMKTKELDDENPFKGTKFNIGFATHFRLHSVNW